MASQQRVPVACAPARAKGARSRLPFNGPLGMADTETTGASLRSRGGMRPLRTRRHVLGAGNASCRDKELRQWRSCVTFSASPRTVTHARQRCALAQYFVGRCRAWQDGRRGCGSRPGWRQRNVREGVSVRAMSQGPQPCRAARLFLVLKPLVCLRRRRKRQRECRSRKSFARRRGARWIFSSRVFHRRLRRPHGHASAHVDRHRAARSDVDPTELAKQSA